MTRGRYQMLAEIEKWKLQIGGVDAPGRETGPAWTSFIFISAIRIRRFNVISRISGAYLCLRLLCVVAGAESIELPPELVMNYAAGRGSWVIVPLQLESGEELRFVVDTGSPITLVDESLAPKLGACA